MNSTNKDCLTYVENTVNFSPEASRAIGIIHLFLCSFCILPYLMLLSVIVSNKSFNKMQAYRIMVHLGIMDIGELISYYVVVALMMITNSPLDFLFNKITNSLANSVWVGEASMVLILAINRFIVLLNIRFPYWLNENLFHNTLLILAYGWSLINFITLILPNMGGIMLPNGFIYESGNSLFCVTDITAIQNIYILGVLGITWVLYLITVVYLIVQRKLLLNDSRIIIGREGQLLLLFMFVCIYKSIICALWAWYPSSDEPSYAVFLTFSLIESGYAPYLYLFMNSTLRNYLFNILRQYFPMNFHATNINTTAVHAW